MILSKAQVEDIRKGNSDSNWITRFCESHEELRKEKEELEVKIRQLMVKRVTVRETCQDE